MKQSSCVHGEYILTITNKKKKEKLLLLSQKTVIIFALNKYFVCDLLFSFYSSLCPNF